jgi:TPR repeat protein
MYENGFGVPPDLVEAINWYQKAASLGNAIAKTRLATLKNGSQQVAVQGGNAALGSVQYRCFLQVDVDSMSKNLGKPEFQRRHDECMRSNWKRLHGSAPFPGDQ